jgi:hypothetical protein
MVRTGRMSQFIMFQDGGGLHMFALPWAEPCAPITLLQPAVPPVFGLMPGMLELRVTW